MSKCLDLVQQSVADMTEKELGEVLIQMKNRQGRLIADGADPATAAAQASLDVAAQLRAAAAIEHRNAAMNFKVRTESLDYIRTTWGDDQAEGVLALLYGSPKARFGSRASVNAAQSALSRRYLAGVAGDLEKAGLFDVLRRGELDQDIARAMYDLGDEAALAKHSPQAAAIAKTLRKWQDVAREDANRAGAWIGKDENYIVKQTHHPDRLQAAGETKWKADILPRLDLNRMFEDGAPRNMDEWLHEAYLNLTTGVRPDAGDAAGVKMSAFKGPGNLAKKASQERVFHFRSADDWFEYNKTYGFGNLRETYVQGLHRAAESTGMMQMLGTNPEFNLQSIVTAIRSDLSRKDPAALRAFDAKTRGGTRIMNGYKEIAGLSRQVASTRLATAGAAVRVWNTLTGLGGAAISSITDVPVRASALKHQGQNYFQELGKGIIAPIKRIVGAIGGPERQATLSALGYFNEIALGNLAARFSPDEGLPGRLQKATHTFFKWNLLGGWQDEMNRSALESMGKFFGEVADQPYAKLSERTQRTLDKFRITADEWDVIRRGTVDENGKFLTPDAVRELPLEHFAGLSSERINDLQTGLYERIQRRAKQDAKEQGWVRGRADKLAAGLDVARKKLDERMAGVEGKAKDEITTLQSRINELDEQLEYAATYWVNPEAPRRGDREMYDAFGEDLPRTRPADAPGVSNRETVGFYGKGTLRAAGVKEGKVRAAMTAMKREAAAIGASLKSIEKRENKAFISKWQEREADFIAFADGVTERIGQREEITARELGQHEPNVNRILEDTREQMAMRIQTLYADEVKSAVIAPDARTMAFVRQGTQSGTPVGEALRLFWQFKTFGIAIMQRAFLREFYGYDKGRGGRLGISELKGLGTLMAGGMAFGYAAGAIKDLIKGKEPRPVNDARTWAAAAAQGGAFGIYGDFMFGESSRFGQSFLTTLGGPTVGKADQVYKLWGAVKGGDDAGALAFRTLINNTPYNNLFYTRMAADYLFLYEMQEAMNPGYLRRMERRVEQDTGQQFYLKPSEVVN